MDGSIESQMDAADKSRVIRHTCEASSTRSRQIGRAGRDQVAIAMEVFLVRYDIERSFSDRQEPLISNDCRERNISGPQVLRIRISAV